MFWRSVDEQDDKAADALHRAPGAAARKALRDDNSRMKTPWQREDVTLLFLQVHRVAAWAHRVAAWAHRVAALAARGRDAALPAGSTRACSGSSSRSSL
eukprot:scaffold108188_cov54-Phaeocystis_antarctica.AAC.1